MIFLTWHCVLISNSASPARGFPRMWKSLFAIITSFLVVMMGLFQLLPMEGFLSLWHSVLISHLYAGVSIPMDASFSPHPLFRLFSSSSGFSNPRKAFSYFPFSSTLSSSVPPRLLVLPRVFSLCPFPFPHFRTPLVDGTLPPPSQ